MSFPQPSFTFTREVEYDILQERFPKMIARSPRNEKTVRVFKLVYELAKKADRDSVRSEFLATKGSAGTTTYTPVDSSTPVTVRFRSDVFKWRQESAVVYSFDLELEEVPR